MVVKLFGLHIMTGSELAKRDALARRYVETEKRLGRSMLMPVKGEPQWLEDVVDGSAQTKKGTAA